MIFKRSKTLKLRKGGDSKKSNKQSSQVKSFKITDEQLNNWKPLDKNHQSPTDCVINVLSFFNIFDEEMAKNLSTLKNQSKTGTGIAEIIYFLKIKFPSDRFIKEDGELNTDEDKNIVFNDLNRIILKSHGIIGLFHGKGHSIGHAIIIAKSKDDRLVILDPQQSSISIISSFSEFNNYITINKYNKLSTITYSVSPNKKNRSNTLKRQRQDTTIQIRKKSNTNNNLKKKIKTSMDDLTDKLIKLRL